VTFKKKAADVSGMVGMMVSRGRHVIALGHGRVRHGGVTVTMHERRASRRGVWTITVVYYSHHRATTARMAVRV
jgi:hypothetical protein